MKCPSCGNNGKPDSRPDPGVPAAFEFRGRLGSRVVVRCLKCNGGVFVRMMPPGYKAVSAEQWDQLDRFWQMRRAEILADIQAQLEFGFDSQPPDEVVAQSQTTTAGAVQGRSSLFHVLGQAGYSSAEDVSRLMHDNPAEFGRFALVARQQTVIHDGYEAILEQDRAPQTERARARIAAAEVALSAGDVHVREFLKRAVASATR